MTREEIDRLKAQIEELKCKTAKELPSAFKRYIAFIEKELGVKVSYASVGPDRSQTIKMD